MKKQAPDAKGGEKKSFPFLLALFLLINTIVIFGIYCFFVMRLNINWVFWVYYGLLGVTALLYVIINRGFALAGVTVDTLSPDLTEEEKKELLKARDERKQKSMWLLTLIFPLCLTVFFDVIYLFFGESIVNAVKAVLDVLGGF